MIKDIVQFFREERSYTFLFLAILTLLAILWLFPPRRMTEENGAASPAVEEFKRAEEALQQRVKNSGSFEGFLKARPDLQFLFQFLTFFAAGIFSIGVIIDIFFVFSPTWRRSLSSGLSPPETTPWKFSMLFKVVLLFIGASIGLSLVFGLIRQFLFPVSINFYLLAHSTIVDVLCFLFVVHVIHQGRGHWRDLGFRLPPEGFWREAAVGLAGYAAILPVFVLVLVFLVMVAHFFAYEPPPHPLVEVFLEEGKRSPVLIGYSVFLACIVGPFFEEIFFRGFCYPIFKKKWGIGWALILSSAFFALIHHSQFAFWPIFILGVALAYVYEKRRSLVASMVLHMVHNTVFIGYFFLAKQIISMGAEGGS